MITILTVGSRGDIQPFIALAQGLRERGYNVQVAAPENFESFVQEQGLPYARLRADYLQLSEDPKIKALMKNPLTASKTMKGTVLPMIRRVLDDAWEAAQGSEAIIFHPKTLAGAHLSEKLGVPTFMAVPLPLYSPTKDFSIPVFAPLKLGGAVNRLSYGMLRFITMPYRGTINAWRQEMLGLPPRKDEPEVPILYAYSKAVVPRPADWAESVHVTGYWFLDSDAYTPPADLQGFLESGNPPVYVGFGSMTGTDAERLTKVVLEGLQQSGQRSLIATGWGGLKSESLPPNVFMVKEAPHDWLFERVAATVHHGGAGTTAAAIRAGKPMLICPFMGDQPFWGARVEALGIAPKAIPQKKLTHEGLAAAIKTMVTDEGMKARAEALAHRVRSEDGVGRAVEVITQALATRKVLA